MPALSRQTPTEAGRGWRRVHARRRRRRLRHHHVDEGRPFFSLLPPLPARSSRRLRRSVRSSSRVNTVGVDAPSRLAASASAAAAAASISRYFFMNAGCSAGRSSGSSSATTIVSPSIVKSTVDPGSIVASGEAAAAAAAAALSPPAPPPAAALAPAAAPATAAEGRDAPSSSVPSFFSLALMMDMASAIDAASVSLGDLADLMKGILRSADAELRFRGSFTKHFLSTPRNPSPQPPAPSCGGGLCAIFQIALIG
mmetsp:Transcript_20557/g.53438  ORF Transcript_20557/g.53438 Transcript_20557/m.53438 type:complete len:255 (+) Transcript_20557:52-816(+)